MIAALFVETGGVYFGLPDVDPWDERRDARLYPGPHRVVAHPPCARWCRLAGLVQARWGHQIGDDDGCFASALESVRKWGGVLEHPAYSKAWATHGLLEPPTGGGLGCCWRLSRLDLLRRAGSLRAPGKEGDVALRGRLRPAFAQVGTHA